MKTWIKFFALSLSVMVLAGCSSCPCKKKTDTVQPVMVPAAPVVVQAPAPVAPVVATPVADKVPAAARKYVNK